jgi:RimJ/RimL family protein N-acetyltransferase
VNVLETERLLLEPLDEHRRDEFVALTALPETMRYWHPDGPWTREGAERRFDGSLEHLREYGFGKRWLVSKETGAGLGFVDTTTFGPGWGDVDPDAIEIGWMLTPSAWGRGYATEAARAIRDEAFERLALDSLLAGYHPENTASGRIMEKLGMTFDRDVAGANGWPLRVYQLSREQWERLPDRVSALGASA